MSNYNSTLQLNNTDLQDILNTINTLPSTVGWKRIADLPITYAVAYDKTYYLELEKNINYVLFANFVDGLPGNAGVAYWKRESSTSTSMSFVNTCSGLIVTDVSTEDAKILAIIGGNPVNYPEIYYYMPIDNISV